MTHHKPLTRDIKVGPCDQLSYLIQAAHAAWEKWMENSNADDPLVPSMRQLYEEIRMAETFLAGFSAGEKSK